MMGDRGTYDTCKFVIVVDNCQLVVALICCLLVEQATLLLDDLCLTLTSQGHSELFTFGHRIVRVCYKLKQFSLDNTQCSHRHSRPFFLLAPALGLFGLGRMLVQEDVLFRDLRFIKLLKAFLSLEVDDCLDTTS